MGILELARRDTQQIVSSLDGWGVAMRLIATTTEVADVVGLHTKHHLSVDADGIATNSLNAHVAINERDLIEQYFPVRNAALEVSMIGVIVEAADSTGVTRQYKILQTYPDETLGLIVCILGFYKSKL